MILNSYTGCPIVAALEKHESEILISLVTGLIAAAAYQQLQSITQRIAVRRKFAHLAGDYSEFEKAREGHADRATGGIVSLKYLGEVENQARFRTSAVTKEGTLLWVGQLTLTKTIFVYGDGLYQHQAEHRLDDTGFHRVLYIPELKQFDVSGGNTSHPGGNTDFKIIWRARPQ